MRHSLAILAILAAGCGSSGGGGDDTSGDDDPVTPDAAAVDLLDPTPMTWQYFEIEGTRCIDGTPAGFSVNYNPASPNLVIYLEGGGACFNAYCESLFTWSGNQPGSSGIFQRDNPDNPVGDWTMVYVPYCTGDVYGGDKETELAGETRHFRGYSNMTEFLRYLVPSFDVDRVVLSGASAGGFGASINFPQVQDAYGDVPVTLLNDSAPPLSSDVFPPCLQTIFRDVWGLDGTMLAECGDDCANADDYVGDYLDHVQARFPDAEGGIFSSLQDNTIRLFAGYGWSNGWNTCTDLPQQVTGAVYTAGLEELRAHLVDTDAPFGTYYVPGSGHTILRSNGFYTTDMGGTSPADWLGATIGGAPAHVGPDVQ